MPFFSPSTGGFYIESVHGRNVPDDAVKITTKRHQELMVARQQGHTVVMGLNGPEIVRTASPEEHFGRALGSIKREARNRILAVATLERQSNDNAALATGAPGESEYDAALARRARINAIREASNAIEGQLNALAPKAIAAFDAKKADWPDV